MPVLFIVVDPSNIPSVPETRDRPPQQARRPAGTILLVEDNEDDVLLLNLMFRRSRIINPICVVNTVQEATRYLNAEAPFADRFIHPFPLLLLLDSHLRDGSGFDLLRWLQLHKTSATLRVVMLTGSDVQDFRMSYELGARTFLTKPLKIEDFRNMVQHVRGITLTSSAEGHLLELQ